MTEQHSTVYQCSVVWYTSPVQCSRLQSSYLFWCTRAVTRTRWRWLVDLSLSHTHATILLFLTHLCSESFRPAAADSRSPAALLFLPSSSSSAGVNSGHRAALCLLFLCGDCMSDCNCDCISNCNCTSACPSDFISNWTSACSWCPGRFPPLSLMLNPQLRPSHPCPGCRSHRGGSLSSAGPQCVSGSLGVDRSSSSTKLPDPSSSRRKQLMLPADTFRIRAPQLDVWL